jgi:hypothetical protein
MFFSARAQTMLMGCWTTAPSTFTGTSSLALAMMVSS